MGLIPPLLLECLSLFLAIYFWESMLHLDLNQNTTTYDQIIKVLTEVQQPS